MAEMAKQQRQQMQSQLSNNSNSNLATPANQPMAKTPSLNLETILDNDSQDNEESVFGVPISLQQDNSQVYYQEWMDKQGITSLMQITPETWKNIAYPVIQAVKLLINSNVQGFQRTHDITLQNDTTNKKVQQQIRKIEKEMSKKEDQYDAQFDRLEKNMTQAFNKFRVDCENQIQKSEIRIEEGYHEMRKQMEDFKDKLSRVDETDYVKAWVQSEINMAKADLSMRLERLHSNQLTEIDKIMQNHLTVPDVIGPKCEFKTLPSYIANLNKTRNTMLNELEQKHQEVKISVYELSQHLDDLIEHQIKETLNKLQEKDQVIQEYLKNLEKKTFVEQLPSLRKQLHELEEEVERQRIDHKVKIELQNNHVQQITYELDKLNVQLKYNKDEIDQKKNESMMYTQEVARQIRDNVFSLTKGLDQQKQDLQDKVRSLQILLDKSEKKILKQQLVLSDKLELITGQSVHLFSEAATPYEDHHRELNPTYIQEQTIQNSLENSVENIQDVNPNGEIMIDPIDEGKSQKKSQTIQQSKSLSSSKHKQQTERMSQQMLNQINNGYGSTLGDFDIERDQNKRSDLIRVEQQRPDLNESPPLDYDQQDGLVIQRETVQNNYDDNKKSQQSRVGSESMQIDQQINQNLLQSSQIDKQMEKIDSVFQETKYAQSFEQNQENRAQSSMLSKKNMEEASQIAYRTMDQPFNKQTNQTGVTFKPSPSDKESKEPSYREKTKSNLKVNTGRTSNDNNSKPSAGGSVSKILSRVDDLEVMMADCMRIVTEILEAVKDSKIPSLARLSNLANSKIQEKSPTDFKTSNGDKQSPSTNPHISALKLQSFKEYFQKMVESSNTRQLDIKLLENAGGTDPERVNNNTPQVKPSGFQFNQPNHHKMIGKNKIHSQMNANSAELLETNQPNKNLQSQGIKARFIKETPKHPKYMTLDQQSLSIVLEDKKRLENENNFDDNARMIAELSNSQLGNVTQGQKRITNKIISQLNGSNSKELLQTFDSEAQNLAHEGSIQDLRKDIHDSLTNNRKSSRGGSSQKAERLEQKLPPLMAGQVQVDGETFNKQLLEQQLRAKRIREHAYQTANNSPIRGKMPEIKPKQKPIAVKYEEMNGIDKTTVPSSSMKTGRRTIL
ncbi:UNKNOWN [Stylonychia lemnae]|uniref:Uncharacterized protein n=1 Tax=Stylonychia lemnae TaxID=5949 RepID=A0A078A4K8_STYLE|nr:UNKNOWN [Stylonychia lemnae]|eukprot:CDW77102.1 UNKNOWN [Stylonychia lemnae]